MIKLLSSLLCLIVCVFSIAAYAQTNVFKGKIYYGYAGSEIKIADLGTKTEKSIIKNASQPFVTANGEVFYYDESFLKKNKFVRKSNATFIQFKDVVDLSPDNPLYKPRLEEYSIIRKTGNSAVLNSFNSPKVSPNNKYLALTIIGYADQIFNKDCVAIFDLSSGLLVKKFDDKYYGTWTPDNRLVMAGSHKTVSVNGSEYHSKNPGIFLADASFTNVTRIDPELDDPAPYHPAVSPDGKSIAFILNNHVWLMDINGKNLKQVTDVANDNIETFPTWSPDGKQIACWAYKTFEKSYFTAIAIVPANTTTPIALNDKAPVWPRDAKGSSISGGSLQMSWK